MERTWDAHLLERPIRRDRRCTRSPRILLNRERHRETVKREKEGPCKVRARSVAILGGFGLTERASRRRAGCSRRNTVVERLTFTPPRALTDR